MKCIEDNELDKKNAEATGSFFGTIWMGLSKT